VPIKPFAPAIALMNRLTYPQKFLIISMLFILPLTLVMYLLLTELSMRREFSQKELYGTTYLRPLRQVLEDILQSQLAVYRLAVGELTPQELGQQQARVAQSLEEVARVDQRLNRKLHTGARVHSLRASWQQWQALQDQQALESSSSYYNLILQKVRELYVHVGNTSNLILDPDLDTYYLMSVSLLTLPKIQDLTSKLLLLGTELISTQARQGYAATLAEQTEVRARLITLSGLLRDQLQELERSMMFAYTHNPAGNVYPHLGRTVTSFVNAMTQHLAALDQVAQSHSPMVFLASVSATNRLLQSGLDLWQQVVTALDSLLHRRIRGFDSKWRLVWGFVCVVLVGVVYLFSSFYLAVMRTVQVLEVASHHLATGQLEQLVVLDNKDELGQVVRSFNHVAAALFKANQDITELNRRLEAENLRMGAELAVTRRLQEMILPNEQEFQAIQGLEIAGFMQPATEVGGDYYDVLQEGSLVKIAMGDVTGHGLESGVLMIMVQTSVRTLLTHQETDPVRFFTTLNRTIYENVRRMQSDKNLTLILLDYEKGRLRLSGQHEELVVVRADGRVERIDTIDLGFPIGLEQDITPFIAQAELHLESGDVVALYTDGVTEAENAAHELYGLERLCEQIRRHCQCSARDIREALIDDVRQHIGQHIVYDDITLLILKQK
jgi:sigma-B regulation protein RsbU (phosphoserine phosphatase)